MNLSNVFCVYAEIMDLLLFGSYTKFLYSILEWTIPSLPTGQTARPINARGNCNKNWRQFCSWYPCIFCIHCRNILAKLNLFIKKRTSEKYQFLFLEKYNINIMLTLKYLFSILNYKKMSKINFEFGWMFNNIWKCVFQYGFKTE